MQAVSAQARATAPLERPRRGASVMAASVKKRERKKEAGLAGRQVPVRAERGMLNGVQGSGGKSIFGKSIFCKSIFWQVYFWQVYFWQVYSWQVCFRRPFSAHADGRTPRGPRSGSGRGATVGKKSPGGEDASPVGHAPSRSAQALGARRRRAPRLFKQRNRKASVPASNDGLNRFVNNNPYSDSCYAHSNYTHM